jgi:two-component SAPR family response regulator
MWSLNYLQRERQTHHDIPHLHCLGSFQAILADRPLGGFHSVKVQAMLAYLVLEADRPHPRETLATLLWPLDQETSARNSLRQALYELRKLLGDYNSCPVKPTSSDVGYQGLACRSAAQTFRPIIIDGRR